VCRADVEHVVNEPSGIGKAVSPEIARTPHGAAAVRQLAPLLHVRPLQLAALTLLLTTIGGLALKKKYFVLDFDIWWHLKVGDWIIAHLAVPHTGILSRTAADHPWVAYSWGYEILLSRAYAWGGLLGLGVFGTFLTVMVALAIYWMLRELSGRFWSSWGLTAVVCAAFLFDGAPRPFFFSMAFFAVMLAWLLTADRLGQIRMLYWLPPMFLVWANLHIQFIYGLAVVGLFAGVVIGQWLLDRFGILSTLLLPRTLPPGGVLFVFVLCVAATLVGPNFYHPYEAVFGYSKAKFTYSIIVELQPLSFRYWNQYLDLWLAAFGFFAVGWQKKLDAFKLLLLVVASVVAFRTMRDAWFLCIVAAACIADRPQEASRAEAAETHPRESWLQLAGVGLVTAVLLAILAPSVDFTPRTFDRAISAEYPVDAINFLRRYPVTGPLYNNLNWGGFLMWYFPNYPVAIDGRNDLYGDHLDEIFFNSQSGNPGYLTDPYLNEAGLVLLDSKLPLAKLLSIDQRFQLVYRDPIATAYVRNERTPRLP